jgi:hypothetical protein
VVKLHAPVGHTVITPSPAAQRHNTMDRGQVMFQRKPASVARAGRGK